MKGSKVLLAFVLCVVVYTTYAKKQNHKSSDKHSQQHHQPHLDKREAENDHYHVKNNLGKDKDPIRPGNGHLRTEQAKTRQPEDSSQPGTPSGSESGSEPSSESSSESSPTLGTPAAPPVPVANLHLDVGKVQVESQTDSCNGVLLEPTFILTSATCVYPNHTAEPYENITFSMGKESKPVKKVFRNPYWHLTGERKENFALLQLQQPMPHQNQKYLASMIWSSYALEDLGDSFVANPDITGCVTASNTARKGDTIRHVDDQPVTLSCSNKGTFDAGSPIFRLDNGAPVVYGVYFGHCTTGSLDRAISGSCGARISKQVFFDFCRQAAAENVELTACDSELLDQKNTNFPTTVFSREGYDARVLRNHNPKATVLAYHSSASKHFQPFVEDIEAIQRLKNVYNMFEIAVVDVNRLPIAVKAVPAIEYRTPNSKAFISYNDEYEFGKFRKFMDDFGRVGAPPKGSTTFLQTVHLYKREDIPGDSLSDDDSQPLHLPVLSNGEHAGGASFVPSGVTCDATAGYYLLPDASCTCLPTHFGGGTTCELLTTVLGRDCEYMVNGAKKTYETIKTDVSGATWCNDPKKTIEVIVKATGDVSGKKLEHDTCADAIADLVACSHNNDLEIFDDSSSDGVTKRGNIHRRSGQNTKTGDAPASFLENFDGNLPPGPLTNAPNTHYYTVAGEGSTASANPYSVLFDGNRGIPLLVGYKVSNANLKLIDPSKTLLRNRWSKFAQPNLRMGSNKIYLGRGNMTRPEAVEEGQLNPNQMHSYESGSTNSMDLTFNHINAFPQYSDFARGVWRKYQEKIISYGKDTCSQKDPSATFYVVSGLSDYELTGKGTSAFLKAATYWPVAYEGAIPQPHLSPDLPDGSPLSIVMPKSVWTVGCCTWTSNGDHQAQTVSIWANNKPRGIPKHEVQPDIRTLGSKLFPGKRCFKFFPATPQCNSVDNHYRMAPPA